MYGYSNQGQGSVTFLYNNGYGSFTADTTETSKFSGWNTASVLADFNNDGLVDIFLLKNWSEDAIYFQDPSSGQKWIRENISLPEGAPIQQRKISVTAFDYDNDGDLDIIRLTEIPFISVYENDGSGHFKDVTMHTGLNVLNQGRNSGQLTAGDYDNNGFIDLFISFYARKELINYIFLNNGKKQFEDKSANMGIRNKQVNFAATCDLDNDGDLDIYGFSEGKNVYWKNNLNEPDFLQIKLTGVHSNSEAIGTKIWVYDKDRLVGYRQTGSMMKDLSVQNQNLVHFGLKPNKKYDVHILFPSGKKIIYNNVNPGTRIYVSEIGFPFSLFYTLDNRIYHLLQNKEFIDYSLIVIIGFLFLIASIAYGTRKFNWDTPLTTLIISLNLFIFGLMLYAFSQYNNVLRYFIPLMIILFGSLSPIGFHLWIKNLFSKKSNKEKEFQLFQTLINFSHGSWAQSNLNSLQLLYENLSVNEINQSDYQEPFNKRKETFFNLTLPVIAEVAAQAKNIAQLKDISEDIEIYQKNLTSLLKIDSSQIKDTDKELFTLNMTKLRSAISKLKKIIFSEHSCHPTTIIRNLEDELKKLREDQQIDYNIFLSEIDTNAKVLMDAVALANILENCIHNATKAMKQNEHKKLSIKLLDKETRVFIEVTDNGPGIEKDKFKIIFENGYSTTGSTGYGLYYSKKILTKYGGRIYVKNSVPQKQTTIVLELQKSI